MTLSAHKTNSPFILLMALLLSVFFGISSNTFHFYTSPSSKATPKAGTVYTTMVPAVAHVRDSSDIVRTLRGAGASAHDVSAIVGDCNLMERFRLLRSWDQLGEEQQQKVAVRHPEIFDALETVEDLQDPHMHEEKSWWQRTFCPTREKFLESVAKPTIVEELVSKHPLLLLGPAAGFAPVAEAATAAIARVVPGALAAAGLGSAWDYMVNFMKPGNDPPTDKAAEPSLLSKAKGPYTQQKGAELADGFKQHLNKLDSPRETIVYEIYRVSDGKTMKFGETAAGFFKSPAMSEVLKRPYSQIIKARKLGDKANYSYREVGSFPTKRAAKEIETGKITSARAKDPNACPWNKGTH